MDPSHRRTALVFIKFMVVGGTGLTITLSVCYFLTEVLHLWYFWSYLFATLLAWTAVFLLNAVLTFAQEGHSFISFPRYLRFIASYSLVFWIGAAVVYTLTSVFLVPYLLSIILGTVTTTSLTFILSKFVIFSLPKG